MKKLILILSVFILLISFNIQETKAAEDNEELLKTDWSFKSFFGTYDRASLQRGYQIYTEVCASCHSMKYLSYRNLLF